MPAPPRTPDRLPRDPRAGLVAARRRPRPRDDRAGRPCSAPLEALECGTHGDRRPPRVAQRHRGQPRRDRRRLRRGRRAGRRARTASPTATAPDGARGAGWPRTSASCAPADAGMVGVHAAFTCTDETLEAAAGLAARPRRRACTSTWPRATDDAARRERLGRPRPRRLAARALRPPRPTTTACGHHRPQPRGRT